MADRDMMAERELLIARSLIKESADAADTCAVLIGAAVVTIAQELGREVAVRILENRIAALRSGGARAPALTVVRN